MTAFGASGAATHPATGALTGGSSQVMGKDEFLRLLVTQLSNQDPLSPMDGQQFAAQLAQFSSVEQLMNIGSTLAGNGEMNALLAQSINSGVAAGLIGKTIEADTNTVGWSGEGEARLGFELGGDAEKITLTIRNEAGVVVRTMELDPHGAGTHTTVWDGKDDAGSTVAKGAYTFEVTATGADAAPVEASVFVEGRVDRVTFGRDGILLWLGEASVPMHAVRSVEE